MNLNLEIAIYAVLAFALGVCVTLLCVNIKKLKQENKNNDGNA